MVYSDSECNSDGQLEASLSLDSPDEAVAGELQTGVGEDSLRPGEEGGKQ